MNFASKFVLNTNEEVYECISDDEFQTGMELSGSSSEHDSEEEDGNCCRSGRKKVQRKGFSSHHWRTQDISITRDDIKDSSKSKRWFRKADTNVVSVSFDTLMSPGSMHAGDPVICSTCGAILSHLSKPASIQNDNMAWKCDFCGNTINIDILPEEIPSSEEVTFLIEAGKATASSNQFGQDESLVVFCVDTSGSMCVTSEVDGKVNLKGNKYLKRIDSFNTEGESQFLPSQKNHNVTYVSRLQAMQAAVDHQLGEMARNFPHRRVALVTFCNDVAIVGDGFQEEVTVAGEKLCNVHDLEAIASNMPAPQAIQKCRKKLGEKVFRLEEGGATALGPALVIAVSMAASHPGSKVIVCTDGKANIGLGNLDDEESNADAVDFYNRIGNEAVEKGVTVSVTTIQGTDCKLVHLGQLADKTGGQVNIVDPLNLTKEFGNILADQIIATNVKSKFLVHKALYIVDENDPNSRQRVAEFNPGNVQSSTTITFEFARRKNNTDKESCRPESDNKKGKSEGVYDNDFPTHAEYSNSVAKVSSTDSNDTKTLTENTEEATASQTLKSEAADESISEFPFQLQIEYCDTEGMKALRVITRSLPATEDRKEAESYANLEVLGTHAAKTSADLALQGEYTMSRGKALMNQRLAWRSCQNSIDGATLGRRRSKYKTIYTKVKLIENQLQQKQSQEIMTHGRTYSDDEADDEDAYAEAEVIPQPVLIKDKKKKKCVERTTEMGDSLANMAFAFRRVSNRTMSLDTENLPVVPLGSSKDMESKKH